MTTDDDMLLTARGVEVYYPIRRGTLINRTVGQVHAVDGVDLEVRRGESFGLVGESGCGKSTLGRGLLQLEKLTGGSVRLGDTDLGSLSAQALRRERRRMQMIFQDPLASMDPRMSVQSLLLEPLRVHGLSAADRSRFGPNGSSAYLEKIRDMIERVGLPQSSLAKYPHEFSGGQRQRIGIARAMVLNPDLVIADEPVSALDVSVQAQVINLLDELQTEFGLTYIVIAHDLAVVRHISDRIGVMYLGRIVEQAESEALYDQPLHPYTISLLSAIPVPDPDIEDRRRRNLLRGDLPSPANPPSGCHFHTRCPYRQPERCATEQPELTEVVPGHRVACHFAKAIMDGEITADPSLVATPAVI